LGRYEDAVAVYDEARARFGDVDEPDLRVAMLRAVTARDRAARRDE
jgi:hypothetical protein